MNDGQLDSLPATVTISVSPENAPPFAPSNLAGVAPSDHQVTLTWTDHSSLEKGFRVERAVDGVTFKQIATVGDNACTFSDLGVQAGKTYTYRVCAYNKQGASTWSNIATVTPVLP